MKNLFHYSWMLGFTLAATLYFTMFDEWSETELVQVSFVWLPMIAFGIAGVTITNTRKTKGLDSSVKAVLPHAFLWTMVTLILMGAFYGSIWEGL